jgi:hypothetical protein
VAARDPELLAEQAEHDWADSVTEMCSERPPSNSTYFRGLLDMASNRISSAQERLHMVGVLDAAALLSGIEGPAAPSIQACRALA